MKKIIKVIQLWRKIFLIESNLWESNWDEKLALQKELSDLVNTFLIIKIIKKIKKHL